MGKKKKKPSIPTKPKPDEGTSSAATSTPQNPVAEAPAQPTVAAAPQPSTAPVQQATVVAARGRATGQPTGATPQPALGAARRPAWGAVAQQWSGEPAHQTLGAPVQQPLAAVGQQPPRETGPPTSPPVTPPQETDLEKEFEKKAQISRQYPKRKFALRPDFLKIGTPVSLVTNHILLKVGKKIAYHYDIDIKEKDRQKGKKDPNLVDKQVEEEPEVARRQNRFTRKLATKLNRKIFKKMIALYSQNQNHAFYAIHPVYDGQKNMFTSKILRGTGDGQPIILEVQLEGESRIFEVTIKLAETNSMVDLDVLNQYQRGVTCDDEVVKKSIVFINTLLRHNTTMDWFAIGQSIYRRSDQGQSLGPILWLIYGFYTSVRNLMIGPTLNVDRSAGCFYETNATMIAVIGHIVKRDLARLPGGTGDDSVLTDADRRKVSKELKGIQIEATHINYGGNHGRKYRVLGLSRDSARTCRFEWKEKENGAEVNKGMVSVQLYFQKKYNMRLRYPQLPVIEVGNVNNIVKLPIEVCRMTSHQRLRRSMTNSEKSEMTRISGQMNPGQRFNYCQDVVDQQFFSGPMATQNRPFLAEFDIDIGKNFLVVDSKVIPPPILRYSSTNSIKPRDGEWEMYKSRAHFVKAATLDKWILINMSFKESFSGDDIGEFLEELRSQAKEMGVGPLPAGPPLPMKIVQIKDSRSFNPKVQFSGIKRNLDTTPMFKDIKMILFITPTKRHLYSDEIYAEIKHLGDVQKGLTTQCVNIESIWNERNRDRPRKWNKSYLRQLMLKINPKLGGINHSLLDTTSMPSIMKTKSLMIVGADVNHPAPADKVGPSIAAMVGSYDHDFARYYTNVTMQPKSREEMIKYVDVMMADHLRHYRTVNGTLPQRIVFYRDGVSEGQFQHALDYEHFHLGKAFKSVDPKYKPKLTFIVVQKRHHTRFMVKETKRNVDPGTVVEKSITHKHDYDFYLCSHAGKIGTSRAAHYYVLADDNNFNSDDMCRMTYYLCHLYQRCTKSVSIPAPVYYADLAAYRAKVLASTVDTEGSDTTSERSGRGGDDDERERARHERQITSYKQAIDVNATQKERLYYC